MAAMLRDAQSFTVLEAARRLGVSGEQLYRWVFEGLVPARPDAQGVVRVDARAVEDLRELSAQLAQHD